MQATHKKAGAVVSAPSPNPTQADGLKDLVKDADRAKLLLDSAKEAIEEVKELEDNPASYEYDSIEPVKLEPEQPKDLDFLVHEEAPKPVKEQPKKLISTGWILGVKPYRDGVLTVISRADNRTHAFKADDEISARVIAKAELSLWYDTRNLDL